MPLTFAFRNETAVLLVLPTISNGTEGSTVPIPTLPSLSTTKEVAVEEPTTKAALPASELTESWAQGEVVPWPMKPVPVMVVVAVPPMRRELPVNRLAKELVEVAEVVVERVMLLKMWAPVQVGEKAWSTVMVFTDLERPVEKVRAGS